MQFLIRRLGHGLFGIYAALIFAVFVVPALALLAVAPRLSTRRVDVLSHRYPANGSRIESHSR